MDTRIIEYRWMWGYTMYSIHRPGDTGQLCQCGSHGLSALTRAWSRSQKAEGPPTRSWDPEDMIFSFFFMIFEKYIWLIVKSFLQTAFSLSVSMLSSPSQVTTWRRQGGPSSSLLLPSLAPRINSCPATSLRTPPAWRLDMSNSWLGG